MPHVASIIHVTDLHLSVRPDGELLELPRRRLLAKAAERLEKVEEWLDKRLHHRIPPPPAAIVELIKTIAGEEQARCGTVVLVQTGDVENNGFVPPVEFGGYRYLHEQVWPELTRSGVTCVDVYGNHDVWPNGFPAPWNTLAHEELSKLRAFETRWPDFVDVDAQPLRLRFHRLNTVRVDARGGVLAQGAVQPHPIAGPVTRAGTEQVASELKDNSGGTAEDPTLNFVVCHHPLHDFTPDSLIGLVEGSEIVCKTALNDRNVVVLAGHRHRFDPMHDPQGIASASVSVTDAAQPPLPRGTGQLVAESATQAPLLGGGGASISVYRINHQHPHGTDPRATAEVSIDRVVHPTGLPVGPDAADNVSARETDPDVLALGRYDRLDHKVLHGLRVQ